jgi:hypothetical protein
MLLNVSQHSRHALPPNYFLCCDRSVGCCDRQEKSLLMMMVVRIEIQNAAVVVHAVLTYLLFTLW